MYLDLEKQQNMYDYVIWLKMPLFNGRCHMAHNAHDNKNN